MAVDGGVRSRVYPRRVDRRRPLVLAFTSAAAAACHEAVWPKLLTRHVGHSAWATGLALTIFMAGLGLGALLPALRPALLARPRRRYALAELTVALGALVATTVLARTSPLSVALGLGSRAVDVLAGAVLLSVPAVAMGATYPLLVATQRDDGRPAASLYLAGLLGCCAGALGCAGVLVPWVGVTYAGYLAAALNVLVALAASSALPPDADAPPPSAPAADWQRPAALFAAAGLFGVGAQVVWSRALVPYAGVSPFAFAAIVAAYVAAQSVGMALGHRLGPQRSTWAAALAPALCLLALGLCAAVSTWPGARDGASLPWVLGTLAAVAAVVAPAAMALGAGQGTVLDAIDGGPGRARAAALATGVGTLVAALGSSLAALVLIPALGPRWTLVALAAPLFVALARQGERAAALVGAAAAAVIALAAPGPRHFLGREFDPAPVLYASDSTQDTTAVILHDQPVEPAIRRLVSAGVSYSGDSLFAQRYMRLLGHLPALATAGRARALIVCVGTGTTLDALRLHDFAAVDAVDLDPTLRDTLRFFAHVHHGAPDDRRVHVHVDDGARWLAATAPGTYDVVTLEPPPPRAPGGSSLYTRELYERARRALRANGVVAQWLPLHDLGAWEAASLVKTFLAVFPDGALYLAERNEAVLLSVRATRAVLYGRAVHDDLAAVGFAGLDPLADTLFADAVALRAASADGALVTDAWPAPELAPLALPRPVAPLSAWADRVADGATPTAPTTFAERMGGALGAFLRVLERSPRPSDRDRVRRAVATLASERPDDVYLQYMRGYGPHLEGRLQRLAEEGVDPALLELTRRRIAAVRARAGGER
jgi:spermidine synthase